MKLLGEYLLKNGRLIFKNQAAKSDACQIAQNLTREMYPALAEQSFVLTALQSVRLTDDGGVIDEDGETFGQLKQVIGAFLTTHYASPSDSTAVAAALDAGLMSLRVAIGLALDQVADDANADVLQAEAAVLREKVADTGTAQDWSAGLDAAEKSFYMAWAQSTAEAVGKATADADIRLLRQNVNVALGLHEVLFPASRSVFPAEWLDRAEKAHGVPVMKTEELYQYMRDNDASAFSLLYSLAVAEVAANPLLTDGDRVLQTSVRYQALKAAREAAREAGKEAAAPTKAEFSAALRSTKEKSR